MHYSESACIIFDWKKYGAYITVDNYGVLRVYSVEITLCGAVNEVGFDNSHLTAPLYYIHRRTPINATEEVIHMEPRT